LISFYFRNSRTHWRRLLTGARSKQERPETAESRNMYFTGQD
jgi:hypothetical protein